MASNRRVVGWLRHLGCVVFAALFLLIVQAPRASAQVDEGAVTGTVVDPSGASIPNASVTLLNTDQGITLESKTNASGSYVFSPVRAGNYSITATASGFETTTQKNLVVSVGGQLQVVVTLKTGASSETVTVTSAPPELQTEESSVGQVMTEKSINDLPLNGRNFTFLAQLGAGVNVAQADTRGNAASGAFTANGLRPAQNNYLLDGIDNNSNAVDFLNGTNFVILPPVDAISEFNVQTADFSAQLGRAAGAVLNATIKTGTNSLHGAVWEFFRNDKLDAADYFEQQKGALRFNQFGASAGGPIIKNKIFFFGDYEGFRRVQGNTTTGVSVPTTLERSSGYTNLTDVITGQLVNPNLSITDPANNPRTDALGRLVPFGAIMDPATTRVVAAGGRDPITGLTNNGTSAAYVRDPFTNGTCNGTAASPYTLACGINQLPAGRLDPNAIKLLNLYPNPTNSQFSGNFAASPKIFEHRNAFDVRGDYNVSQKDQLFVRFSYVDDPQFIPGPFGGIADGGAFQQGLQTAKSDQAVLGYTHVFTPNVINVFHAGFNHLHSTRFGPEGNVSGIPAQFGIQGIPQGNENGGLPAIVISGLSELGSNDFLPSDEVSQTLQLTDDFTKIFGKNSFKMGVEYQDIHFNTLQPAFSRGEFDFNGNYAGVPGQTGDNTGRAQFLLTPTTSTVGGPDGIGGANKISASNISKTYDQRSYLALYFQDDLKVNEKLTLNLGLRYDYFSPIAETNGGQANFVQSGPPNGVPTFLIPASGKAIRALSPSFIALTAQDGIAIDFTNKYGKGLVQTQKSNFAPRAGFAYQVNPRTVVRGGLGLFFNAFENQGYGPNIGENYPFIYNFGFSGTTDSAPFSSGANPYNSSCPTAGVGGSAPIGAGLSCVAFTPTAVNASGLGLQGLQFNSFTPRTFSTNLSFQYALTHSMSAQIAYVLTDASHLQVGTNNNTVTQLVPANTALTRDTTQPDTPTNHNYVPFPDFAQGGSYQRTLGSSIYNGLQTKLEQTLNNGLSFLATYTYSKTLTDAGDLLNGGSVNGFRAPNVPGLGPRFDWGLASFDIRNVVHLSGGYELPVGKNKMFLANSGKLVDNTLGGWSLNFIVTLQGGQPLGFSCPTGTTSGTNCNDILVGGQSPKLGIYKDSNGLVNWIGNKKAFAQPCQLGFDASGAAVPIPESPAGCVPLTGSAALGGGPSTTYGPGFHRLDLSAFKNVKFSERVSAQFRAEFFNILNHPNFNSPNFGGNGVTAISGSGNFNSSAFGEIGSTRDAPFDPRQIQFALKLYY